ncbi:MAG: histidine kinase [Actinomycetales bacterium]
MNLAHVPPDLASLTGVRSGKPSYYRHFVRSDQRMRDAVLAMDSISRALVSPVQGPRALLEGVVRAAGRHLRAEWVLLALADHELPGARPRLLALDPQGTLVTEADALPHDVAAELRAIRAGSQVPSIERGWARVSMRLADAVVGSLTARHGLDPDLDPDDLAVLRILANQAAVSLHAGERYQESQRLYGQAQRLHAEVEARRADLDQRTAQLRQTRDDLVLARQRELLDAERHRIARELHDSVTQTVLSAGLCVQVARHEIADGSSAAALAPLDTARELTDSAVEQLRRAIYSLQQPAQHHLASLPTLLRAVAGQHESRFSVTVRVSGTVVPVPHDGDHELVRCVGEALYNVASHAQASRVCIRVTYQPQRVLVSVADNGRGRPEELTRLLRLEREAPSDGRHRGLALMEERIAALGGTLTLRGSRIGGVRVELRVPLDSANHRPGLRAMSTPAGQDDGVTAGAHGHRPAGDGIARAARITRTSPATTTR